MGTVSELIRKEADGTISFGDYTLDAKSKLDNYEVGGDLYKVKTFKEMTKLEKNGLFQSERGARADVGGRCPYEHLKFSGFSHPFVAVGIKIGEGGARD